MVAVVVVCRYFVYLFMLLVLKSDVVSCQAATSLRSTIRAGKVVLASLSGHVLSSPGALNATCKQYN